MTTLTASRMLASGRDDRSAVLDRRTGVRALVARMAAASRARADRRHLADMPDHILRDIGLTRDQIDSVIR